MPGVRHPFQPIGKRRYCRDACRVAAHRRRHQPPPDQTRRSRTVYQCTNCDARALTLPVVLDVGDVAGDEDEVEWSIPHPLIGDAHVSCAPRVPGLRWHRPAPSVRPS